MLVNGSSKTTDNLCSLLVNRSSKTTDNLCSLAVCFGVREARFGVFCGLVKNKVKDPVKDLVKDLVRGVWISDLTR